MKFLSPMLAAMTLAYLVKQSGLRCHVTVGGPHITMLREPHVPVESGSPQRSNSSEAIRPCRSRW